MKYPYLFSPIQIGPMLVKDRFVMSPMGNNFANTDGTWSERSRAYYEERARGGFGLITIEATVVDKKAKGGLRKPCLYDDSTVESLRRVVGACHAAGAKVSIQLQHAGSEGNAKAAGYPICAASPIPAAQGRDIPRELTREEIYQLVEAYGDAALRAKRAGVDAVELHCAHGYLLSGFISPRTNKRVDEFGGCFENRMRLPRLILENIMEKTGHTIAVLCRINASDEMEGGIDIHDSAAVGAYLEACGVDALHVSRSVHLRDEFMWAPTAVHAGFNADQAAEIKRCVGIPVITVGRYTDPYFAELMLKSGRCDLIAFGRQSIADPYMPQKCMDGQEWKITPCIGCLQGCVPNMFKGEPVTCLVNPAVGLEEKKREKAERAKHIAVVGGGPGGMYAAMALAQRGHRVDLYEATDKLGGQMRIAAFPPGKGDITTFLENYAELCRDSGVTIHMGTPVTAQMLSESAPDAVVLATGARPLVPPIPGADAKEILHAVDVLDGKARPGKKVLLIGGGMVGSETADFLAQLGHEVTVIEMRDTVASDVAKEHAALLYEDFRRYGVQCITGAKVEEIRTDGVYYSKGDDGGRNALLGFDSVILALGAKAFDPLQEDCKKMGLEVYLIGDAVKARRALSATREAFEVSLKL